ncbi:MAG TPA: hypothetical protein ENK58_00135 [Desulfobacterales bacterium]|nr:hypothetical protein [Desulfobacterales bacterium]
MNEEHVIKKTCKTLFPMGFGVKKTEDRIIILDFVNQIDDKNYEIFSSLAMSEIKAKELMDALDRAINEEERENDKDDDVKRR